MKNLSKIFLLSSFFLFCLSIGHSQGQLKNLNVQSTTGFNYGIKSMRFEKDRSGKDRLKIETYLVIDDKSNNKIIMNHDVQIHKNGRLIKTIKQNARKDNAINCAVKCKGTCPSVLKTGKCVDCKCDYSNYLSANPKNPRAGDVFEVKLVRARKGAKDARASDNSKRIVYKQKSSNR